MLVLGLALTFLVYCRLNYHDFSWWRLPPRMSNCGRTFPPDPAPGPPCRQRPWLRYRPSRPSSVPCTRLTRTRPRRRRLHHGALLRGVAWQARGLWAFGRSLSPPPGFDGPRRSRPRTASRDGERALPANPGPYWSGGGAASVATRRRCTVAFL